MTKKWRLIIALLAASVTAVLGAGSLLSRPARAELGPPPTP